MRFRILGPLQVLGADGQPLQLEPRLVRLLATLLLAANQVVTRERLVEAVWDDEPPTTVDRQLKNLISALRRQLAQSGGVEQIVFDTAGYRIVIDDGQIDARVFARHVTLAKAFQSTGHAVDAVREFRAGLALWRGPAADSCPTRVVRAVAISLDEQRMAAIEQCLDLELALGNHGDLVGELAELVTAHPLRERLVGQLMLALYRGGRQADSLHVYEQLRARLAADLGCDPGPQLHHLHTAILRNDPDTLGPASPAQGSGAPTVRATTSESASVSSGSLRNGEAGIEPSRLAQASPAVTADAADVAEGDNPPPARDVPRRPATSPTLSERLAAIRTRHGLTWRGNGWHGRRLTYLSALAVLTVGAAATIHLTGDNAPRSPASRPIPDEALTAEPASSPTGTTREKAAPRAQHPLSVKAGINLVEDVRAQGGHMGYIFDKPVGELSPPPADHQNPLVLATWAYANGGGDADTTYIKLSLQGIDEASILINRIEINIISQKPTQPLRTYISKQRFTFKAEVLHRRAEVNLDDTTPFIVITGDLTGTRPWETLRVSHNEPEIIHIQAKTSRFDCTWTATLHYSINDREGTVPVDNRGKPFRTIASTGSTTYGIDTNGRIVPTERR
ncbi:BTAD domain-containing putative transcriptional regulator [Polymorphospora sp. NPDC051019]|uniref:AfsR/SARP family transcriptional regulator n=1 Tax=Polymorphospora sp. NPDC051019 TaxID=3155725 RepID=UPI003432504A